MCLGRGGRLVLLCVFVGIVFVWSGEVECVYYLYTTKYILIKQIVYVCVVFFVCGEVGERALKYVILIFPYDFFVN